MSTQTNTILTIKFKLVTLEPDNYHIVVKAKIEGHPLNVIIDTGASHSCFDLEFVRQLSPEISMEDNDGLNVGVGTSDFESKLSSINNFRMGRFLLKQYNVVLLDMSNINQAYAMMHKPLIHGIIGSDFLMKYQAVIDYGSRVLMLRRDGN
jgi:hypothetical protein